MNSEHSDFKDHILEMLDGITLNNTEAETISEKFGIEVSRVEEGLTARDLIAGMPKRVLAGSRWIVMPMTWIKKWQEYIYFD